MSSVVLRHRIRNLMIMSSVGALSISLSACSSGFQRFDRSIYNEAVPGQYSSNTQNAYPGYVDYTTTASTRNVPIPAGGVGQPAVPQGVYHSPEPTYVQPQYTQPQPMPVQPQYQAPTRQPYSGYEANSRSTSSSWSNSSGAVKSSTLSKIEKTLFEPASAPKELSYTPPIPDSTPRMVYIPEAPDTTAVTATVKRESTGATGWTGTGGTRLTVRQGETLYNLSKRYGVPASEIRKVNNLKSSASLKAGQTVIIPTYVYGPNTAVSAPDNDPKTRAASAGTGYIGESRSAVTAVPSPKPVSYTPISYAPPAVESVSPPAASYDGSVYVVRSGDSLSAIASRTGTTVSALKAANKLSGSNIQVGQKLIIPQGIDATTTSSINPPVDDVDPIVTGPIKQPKETSATEISSASGQLEAPEQTGISQFRWPVRGKVIENFGDSVAEGKNEGIDISVPEGTAVRSAENGIVIYAGSEISEYGKLVLVRHTNGWVSAYAHNRSFEVKKGDRINRGQIIARSGKTGNAERPKLHFELRKESQAVDPVKHLAAL